MTAPIPERTAAAASDHVLDNAGWHALTGPHASFAQGGGRVRRYDPDVSVFHAAVDDSEEAWRELATLATPEGIVVVFRAPPVTPPPGWAQVFGGHGHQMVPNGAFAALPRLPSVDPCTGRRVTLRSLGVDDLDDMIALVALTEPGPFRPRTIELGGYIGIFHDDELVAMAGQRLRPPGYCEVRRGVHASRRPTSRLCLDRHDSRRHRDRGTWRDTVPPRRQHQHVRSGLVRAPRVHHSARRFVRRVPRRRDHVVGMSASTDMRDLPGKVYGGIHDG